MVDPTDSTIDFSAPAMVEGFAHVVSVEGGMVWLEPEQTTSCGSCASSSTCGAKGLGTTATRLEARRFQIVNSNGLAVGERVVVGVSNDSLVKGSLTAYLLPLVTMLVAGGVAQWWAGSDGITMLAMVSGLALGLVGARWGADHLFARGKLVPRFLRRAGAGETCQID